MSIKWQLNWKWWICKKKIEQEDEIKYSSEFSFSMCGAYISITPSLLCSARSPVITHIFSTTSSSWSAWPKFDYRKSIFLVRYAGLFKRTLTQHSCKSYSKSAAIIFHVCQILACFSHDYVRTFFPLVRIKFLLIINFIPMWWYLPSVKSEFVFVSLADNQMQFVLRSAEEAMRKEMISVMKRENLWNLFIICAG